jgi:UDP:flavonoid glycosyltransferase YjiC (YdhE family)
MLLIPHGRDQDDNAARIVARGAGLNVLSEATTAEIRAALHRLLNDQSYSQAASALGSRVAEETEASKIVEELEKLAKPAATQKQIDALPAPVGLAL